MHYVFFLFHMMEEVILVFICFQSFFYDADVFYNIYGPIIEISL